MPSVSQSFSKTLLCPSAEELLSFRFGALSAEHSHTSAQLAQCSFCDAELQFLCKYPPLPTDYVPAVMPAHLHLLAYCLLSDVSIEGLQQLVD